jgi:hypothetical protein
MWPTGRTLPRKKEVPDLMSGHSLRSGFLPSLSVYWTADHGRRLMASAASGLNCSTVIVP